MKMINVAKDFSRFPGGRLTSDGPNSGELFRKKLLERAMRSGDEVTVILDDVAGLPVSFLEEAFGGLVRSGFDVSDIKKKLRIVATTPRVRRYPEMIWQFIDVASSSARS